MAAIQAEPLNCIELFAPLFLSREKVESTEENENTKEAFICSVFYFKN
jgi:hypothetical protein